MTAEEAGYWAGCHKGQTKQISRNEEAGAVGAPINPMKAQSSFYYLPCRRRHGVECWEFEHLREKSFFGYFPRYFTRLYIPAPVRA